MYYTILHSMTDQHVEFYLPRSDTTKKRTRRRHVSAVVFCCIHLRRVMYLVRRMARDGVILQQSCSNYYS